MLLPILLALQAAHDGRAGDLHVTPPRIEASVTIDGDLSEPVWQRAAMLTGFSQYQPVDGRPAVDSTEVLIWYAPDAMYFGIKAFEPHGEVHATLADRDRIDSDDYVQILLDTFDDHRRAFVLGVNPLGVQADGIRSEGAYGAGGRNRGGNFENVDMNPDYVYDSKGVVTPWGYQVEVRVPFKTLPFGSGDPQTWSINVLRRVQHSGYLDTWTPAVRANASFLVQSGTLEGLTGMHRGLVLDVNPFVAGRANGAPDSAGTGWTYDRRADVGGSVRWGVTNNLALDATINPDFSQVEADVGQVTVNERFAIFYPEKRPFFLEGIDQFNTPNQLIYTRRVVDPVAGAKLTGKVGRTSIGIMTAVDAQSTSLSGTDYPVISVARLRTDLGGSSTIGLTYTDRIDGGNYNRVAAADARIVFARLYFVELQAGGSATDSLGNTSTAPLWSFTADRTGRHWGFHYTFEGIDPDFRAQAGFVNRTGIIHPTIMNRLSFYGAPGALVEQWTTYYRQEAIWNYDDFPRSAPLEGTINANSSITFRGNWTLGLNPQWQSIAFDSSAYTNYYVDRGADTAAFTVPQRLNDLFSGSVSLSTPQFATFAASGSVGYGRTAAFFEPASANAFQWSASLDWRPNDQLRVSGQYQYTAYDRVRDGTRLSTARIPRLKLEYQISAPVFVRFVGQYDAESQDALRDPRTDQPILRGDGSGGFGLADATVSNNFRVDWLFSYHPNPGTVVYLGYGSSLTAPDAFQFHNLARVNDGFFVKVSYLFRM